jgi:hypothetical protein
MKKSLWIAPLLALGLIATPALAAEDSHAAKQEQASIPFVHLGGIRDWQMGNDRETIYVQDRHRDWYKATLMYPSTDLPYEWAIGFDTGTLGKLDRFSSVVIGHQKIPLKSLVAIEGAPPAGGLEA